MPLEGRTAPGAVGVSQPALRRIGQHLFLEPRTVCTGNDIAVLKTVVLLVFRIAHHQTFLRIPKDEGFVDVLDRRAQAQVGGFRAQCQMALLGDVDGDADELDLRRVAIHDLRAGAHPDPMAVGMAHAEDLVDLVDLARDDAAGELE